MTLVSAAIKVGGRVSNAITKREAGDQDLEHKTIVWAGEGMKKYLIVVSGSVKPTNRKGLKYGGGEVYQHCRA